MRSRKRRQPKTEVMRSTEATLRRAFYVKNHTLNNLNTLLKMRWALCSDAYQKSCTAVNSMPQFHQNYIKYSEKAELAFCQQFLCHTPNVYCIILDTQPNKVFMSSSVCTAKLTTFALLCAEKCGDIFVHRKQGILIYLLERSSNDKLKMDLI